MSDSWQIPRDQDGLLSESGPAEGEEDNLTPWKQIGITKMFAGGKPVSVVYGGGAPLEDLDVMP
jgi:hypothetical protein